MKTRLLAICGTITLAVCNAKCYLSSISSVTIEPRCEDLFAASFQRSQAGEAVKAPTETTFFTTTGCDVRDASYTCQSNFDDTNSLDVHFAGGRELIVTLGGDLRRAGNGDDVMMRILYRALEPGTGTGAGANANRTSVSVDGFKHWWNVTKGWIYSPVLLPMPDRHLNVTVLDRTDIRFDRVLVWQKEDTTAASSSQGGDAHTETVTGACVCAPIQHFLMVNSLAIALPVGFIIPMLTAWLYLAFVRKQRVTGCAKKKQRRIQKAKILTRRPSYKRPTFKQILGDVNLRTRFRTYLTSHQAAENLLFVEEVEHFEKISQDHFLQKEGLKILQRFVLQDSPLQVNLSSDARNATNIAKGFNSKSFQRPKKEIEVLLEQNYYNSFVQTLETDHFYA